MLHRIVILLLALALPAAAVQTELKPPRKIARLLNRHADYRNGANAMADHLYNVAIPKFRKALTDKKLPGSAKPYVTMALAEALIRTSLTPKGTPAQAEEALKLLAEKNTTSLPSAAVWKAEAMASLGRYNDANDALAKVPANHPLHSQIQLARARTLLALQRIPEAMALLLKLGKSKSPRVSNTANLLLAELHINAGHLETAAQSLDLIDGQNAADARLKEYLGARLALAGGDATDAANRFQSLVTAPDDLEKRIFHTCILGMADAQAADKQPEAAASTLLRFIGDYPNSPALPAAFSRLSALLDGQLPDNAPALAKLKEWSSAPTHPADPLCPPGASSATVPVFQPQSSKHSDRTSLALYHRALTLARTGDTNKQNLAMALLAKLRMQHTSTSQPLSGLYLRLASASLLDTAYLHLKQNQPAQATFTLSVMEKAAFSPQLKDQASFLRGLLLAKEGNQKTALEAFNYARQSGSDDIARAATVNSAIEALANSDLEAFSNIMEKTKFPGIRSSLILERALWKCSKLDPTGRAELESFIFSHTGHPRENEARLALAAACVNITPHDLDQAKAQLDVITPRLTTPADQLTIARIYIRAEELARNWTAAADIAGRYIKKFPQSHSIPALQFKRGEAYYHNEDYNKARQIFQDIPGKFPDSPFAPHARFLAAMSARLGGTPQARQESIGMFQKIIDSKSPLAPEARIQQSRILIDLRRYQDAEKTLSPLLKAKNTPAILRRAAGVLMADCLHRQGSLHEKKYQQAIDIYNNLLADKTLPLAWKNRLHYLRGQTYESMSKTDAAFTSYYDIILNGNTPKDGAPNEEEWLWFYRCGFKALAILENDQRWEAAVKLARRIAAFNGPRAEEASKRANTLAKTHMIWERIDPDPIPPKPDTKNTTTAPQD